MRTASLLMIVLGSVASAGPAAKLTFGTPKITGALDAKDLRTVVQRSSDKLLGCYRGALAKSCSPSCSAIAKFTIGGDGKVTAAAATGLPDEADACIAATFSKIKFATPKDGQPIDVAYALSYTPSHVTPLSGGRVAAIWSTEPDDSNLYGGLLGQPDDLGGGFGGGRTGPPGIAPRADATNTSTSAGGGTGQGYAAGSGSGLHGHSTAPTISIGQPVVTGDLDKAIIRRYVKRNAAALLDCYEKELRVTRTLRGTLTTEFTIGADGKVRVSTANGVDNKAVESCVATVIQAIEFPKPHSGQVTVAYPMTFRPADPPAPAAKP